MTMITEIKEGGKVGFAPASSGAVPTSALLTVINEPGAALPNTGGPGYVRRLDPGYEKVICYGMAFFRK